MDFTPIHIEDLEEARIGLRQKRTLFRPYMIFAPFMAVFAGMIMGLGAITIPLVVATIVGSIITNHTQFVQPFKLLKSKYKRALVDEIMQEFHPEINYLYSPTEQDGKKIIKAARLVSGYNRMHEEDVLTGEYKSADFYLSEIDLTQDNGKGAQHVVYSGLLFRISNPEWNFPKSQVQSKRNLLQRWFGSFRKNEKFDFWYDTKDQERFFAALSRVFPFIHHLNKNNRDVRIHTDGSEMTILLKTDMDLLDDNSLKMSRSFINEEASQSAMRQLNSLLYIVDTFIGEEEDNLELPDLSFQLQRPLEILAEQKNSAFD